MITLSILFLNITITSISFLSTQFVTSELFCGEDLQYSHKFEYRQTYIVHDIPDGFDSCLLKNFDGINYYTKIIELDSSFLTK